jgi:TolB protein
VTATVSNGTVQATAVSTATPTPSLTPTTTPSPPLAIAATTQGRFIVFTRIDRDTNGDGTVGWSDKRVLFRVDVDSGSTIQLTDYNANAASSSWSPDGRQIVFASDRDGDYELFVMDNDGNNERQLTFNNATDHGPVWSADGRWLVFHRGTDEAREIFRMHPDGSNEVRLTANNIEDQYPVWSPDGQRIAYESAGRIIIADFDGNMLEQLPLSSPFNSAVCWSPDGRYLVYAGHQSQDGAAQIYVWDLIDRSERVVVTDNSGEPCWSPDGSRIVYSRWEPRLPQIWISARFGGGDQRITSSAGYDTQPAWSP